MDVLVMRSDGICELFTSPQPERGFWIIPNGEFIAVKTREMHGAPQQDCGYFYRPIMAKMVERKPL
jgi:hypothetical protein